MCVTLVEGQDLGLDSQGGQVFVCFKLGEQTYKSKVAMAFICFSLSSSLLSAPPELKGYRLFVFALTDIIISGSSW